MILCFIIFFFLMIALLDYFLLRFNGEIERDISDELQMKYLEEYQKRKKKSH